MNKYIVLLFVIMALPAFAGYEVSYPGSSGGTLGTADLSPTIVHNMADLNAALDAKRGPVITGTDYSGTVPNSIWIRLADDWVCPDDGAGECGTIHVYWPEGGNEGPRFVFDTGIHNIYSTADTAIEGNGAVVFHGANTRDYTCGTYGPKDDSCPSIMHDATVVFIGAATMTNNNFLCGGTFANCNQAIVSMEDEWTPGIRFEAYANHLGQYLQDTGGGLVYTNVHRGACFAFDNPVLYTSMDFIGGFYECNIALRDDGPDHSTLGDHNIKITFRDIRWRSSWRPNFTYDNFRYATFMELNNSFQTLTPAPGRGLIITTVTLDNVFIHESMAALIWATGDVRIKGDITVGWLGQGECEFNASERSPEWIIARGISGKLDVDMTSHPLCPNSILRVNYSPSRFDLTLRQAYDTASDKPPAWFWDDLANESTALLRGHIIEAQDAACIGGGDINVDIQGVGMRKTHDMDTGSGPKGWIGPLAKGCWDNGTITITVDKDDGVDGESGRYIYTDEGLVDSYAPAITGRLGSESQVDQCFNKGAIGTVITGDVARCLLTPDKEVTLSSSLGFGFSKSGANDIGYRISCGGTEITSNPGPYSLPAVVLRNRSSVVFSECSFRDGFEIVNMVAGSTTTGPPSIFINGGQHGLSGTDFETAGPDAFSATSATACIDWFFKDTILHGQRSLYFPLSDGALCSAYVTNSSIRSPFDVSPYRDLMMKGGNIQHAYHNRVEGGHVLIDTIYVRMTDNDGSDYMFELEDVKTVDIKFRWDGPEDKAVAFLLDGTSPSGIINWELEDAAGWGPLQIGGRLFDSDGTATIDTKITMVIDDSGGTTCAFNETDWISEAAQGDVVAGGCIEVTCGIETRRFQSGDTDPVSGNCSTGLYVEGRSVTPGSTTLSSGSYVQVEMDYTEVGDPEGKFSLGSNLDEICYDGDTTKSFLVQAPLSMSLPTGGASEIMLSFGVDTEGNIANGDEVGSSLDRTVSGSQKGMGSLSSILSLGKNDCIGIMVEANAGGTLQIHGSNLVISPLE